MLGIYIYSGIINVKCNCFQIFFFQLLHSAQKLTVLELEFSRVILSIMILVVTEIMCQKDTISEYFI